MNINEIIYPNIIVDERKNYYFVEKFSGNTAYLNNAIESLYKRNKNNREVEWQVQLIHGARINEKDETKEIDPAELLRRILKEIELKKTPIKLIKLEDIDREYELVFLNPWE